MATKLANQWKTAVAEQGCCICGSPANVHHIRSGMGMGQRNNDFHSIPLCHHHHQGAEGIHHLGTKQWQERYAPEEELLVDTVRRIKATRRELWEKLQKDEPEIARALELTAKAFAETNGTRLRIGRVRFAGEEWEVS